MPCISQIRLIFIPVIGLLVLSTNTLAEHLELQHVERLSVRKQRGHNKNFGKEMYIMSEDFVDSVLRCGLYLGAVFQLICIAAAVVLPDKVADSSISYCKELDFSEDEGSDHSTPQATPRRPHAHHRPRKQEKKKRR